MKLLITDQELANTATTKLVPLACYHCHVTFYATVKRVRKALRGKYGDKCKYCSKECCTKSQIKYLRQALTCANCSVNMTRSNKDSKRFKNLFCSRSCRTMYYNTHKVKGTKVSKLERWLQDQLKRSYPNIEFKFNDKTTINSELDIYIPELKLAVELNGIFHYEPIYGSEKLIQIQNNDNRKFQACIEHGLELVIIDVSSLTYFKESKADKFLKIVISIIEEKIRR